MRLAIITVGLVAWLGSSSPALAQTHGHKAHAETTARGEPSIGPAVPSIEPAALDALTKMSDFLKSLDQFELTAQTTTEYVLKDGQKVMLPGTATIRVRRPDRFMIDVSSDRKARQFYYDGKTLTVFAPRQAYYAVVDAPPTIHETLDAAYDKYGIALPLQDVFEWGDPKLRAVDFESAIWVGPGKIGDEVCDQYAYRTKKADLQIWIARGDKPIARKIVITGRLDSARPQYVANLDWRLDRRFADDAFTFKPPPDAKKISIASYGS
jgi:hypothetical protein